MVCGINKNIFTTTIKFNPNFFLIYSLSLEERIGLAMKHSGVAITITSVTDLLAFGIGATSILPALGNFCLYAALGIFAVFLQMASFFLAWLVIDQRRIDARRDGILCCTKKEEDWVPNECSQNSFMDMIFRMYANAIVTNPVKVVVLLMSAAIFGVACYGVSQLESNFDVSDWFPPGSSVVTYLQEKERHFSSGGVRGKVYVSGIPKIEEKLEKIESLTAKLGELPDLSGNQIRSVLSPFFQFLNKIGITDKKLSNQQLRTHLRNFICTFGLIFMNDVHYVGGEKLNCLTMKQTPEIQMMTFGYQHKR